MEMPGFWTWPFWNSPLVTTVLGTLIFTGLIALAAAIISDRLAKRRRVFDFQLEIFQNFNQRIWDFYDKFRDLAKMRATLDKEFTKKVLELQTRYSQFIFPLSIQAHTAFRDVRVFEEIDKLDTAWEQICDVMKGGEDWSLGTLHPLMTRYIVKVQVIMLRMRKQMHLIGVDDYNSEMASLEEEVVAIEAAKTDLDQR